MPVAEILTGIALIKSRNRSNIKDAGSSLVNLIGGRTDRRPVRGIKTP